MRRSPRPCRCAFTIVELLVVVSIIGLLVGILLPAVNSARSKAKETVSQSNLRQLGVAHANYASTWNGRQFTLAVDNMTKYGDNAQDAVLAYIAAHRLMLPNGDPKDNGWPPPIELGWGTEFGGPDDDPWFVVLDIEPERGKGNYTLLAPITFKPIWGPPIDRQRFGYFRMPNARQFSQYISGRFFDAVFYAPKDEVVMDMREGPAESPWEYAKMSTMQDFYGWEGGDFCYSSYSLSPAALFSPDVFRNADAGGFQDPWTLAASFRAPAMGQALYPDLKTHMLEHHWLQGARSPCNPAVVERGARPYRDCQPYFFNQAMASSPAALFYDGHVELIGVGEAMRADGRHAAQAGYGLWSRDTPFKDDGYWIERGYDQANTSFHILTTEGIRGRDRMADG